MEFEDEELRRRTGELAKSQDEAEIRKSTPRHLPGEDPSASSPQEVRHWVRVYRDLADFKRRLLSEVREEIRAGNESVAAELRHDERILDTERARIDLHLAFWTQKLDDQPPDPPAGPEMELDGGPDAARTPIGSIEELEAVLDRLAAAADDSSGYPPMVTLFAPGPRFLAVGVGGPYSVALWGDLTGGDGRIVRARGSAPVAGPLRFLHNGVPLEIPPDELITNEEAREAVRRFFEAPDDPPAGLTWGEATTPQ